MLPEVKTTVQDGALGIAGPDTDNVHVKIGVASKGTKNTLLSFTDKKQVKDTLGTGPLAESLAVALTKIKPVYAIRAEASTAGTVSAVTATRVSTSTGTVAVSGTPLDSYQVTIEITTTGGVGAGAFKYTLDGGDVYSPAILIPSGGSYAIPDTGLTLTFTDGVGPIFFEKGDKFAFTTAAPAMTLTDLNAAIDAMLADSAEWAFLHVVGETTPTVAAGVNTRMDEAATKHRFAFAVLEARDIGGAETEDTWMTALKTEWKDFASTRVEVIAGHSEVVSQLTGRVHRRSIGAAVTARIAAIDPQVHPGEVNGGPVSGITKLYHDEEVKPGLDEARFTTLRTIIGRQGFYVTRGRMMAPAGSDYQFVMNRRVVDKACKITRNAALRFLNSNVRVDDAGNIAEADARAIEAYIDGQLFAGLISTGNASKASVTLKRDSNVLSTQSTTLTIRVTPVGYLETIEVDIGLFNPALAAA